MPIKLSTIQNHCQLIKLQPSIPPLIILAVQKNELELKSKSNKLKLQDNTTAKKPNDLNSALDNNPTANDAQLPFQHASLDTNSDENNHELTSGTNDAEEQSNLMQLQFALDITVDDYLKCPEFGDIMRYKLTGQLSDNDAIARKTLLIADEFLIVDNLLYRVTTVRNKKLQRVRPHLTRLRAKTFSI